MRVFWCEKEDLKQRKGQKDDHQPPQIFVQDLIVDTLSTDQIKRKEQQSHDYRVDNND
jgi:hypothetical protein